MSPLLIAAFSLLAATQVAAAIALPVAGSALTLDGTYALTLDGTEQLSL